MTNANINTLLMNPATGSVAPEAEWREDFEAMAPEDREDLWGSSEFWGSGLIEVIPDGNGWWVEAQ